MNKNFFKDDYVDVLNSANLLKRTGSYDRAVEYTKGAIHMNPHRSIAYYNLGKLLYIKGHYDQSIKSYQKAIEFNYDAKQAVIHLGHSILARSMKDELLHMFYRTKIDPYFRQSMDIKLKDTLHSEVSEAAYRKYEKKAIEAGIEYMNKQIDE